MVWWAKRRPIINIMPINQSGSVFSNSMNVEGFTKDRYYIVDRLIEKIN